MAQQDLTIAEVCGILEKEVRPNTLSLGIDGAQNHTGICLLRTTKTKLYVEEFWGIDMKGVGKGNLHPKLIDYLHRCKEVREDIPKFSGQYNKRVIIEDCYFGMSVWTTKVLAKYSTVSFFTFRKWADEVPEPIQPVSARKKVGFSADAGKYHYEMRDYKGKKKRRKIWDRKPLPLKEQIINWIDENFYLEIEDDNLSDAFILALSGLVE
jgi:hypothetical protein